MAIVKDNLRASRDAALAAKSEFVAAYGSNLSNCAVGLGLSRDGQDWALKVYVQSPKFESHLPEYFQQFEVDVEVAGPVTVY